MKRKRCTMCDRRFQLYDKYANLHFEKIIGYGSVHDGETFKINLCCECFDKFADILNLICKKNIFQ